MLASKLKIIAEDVEWLQDELQKLGRRPVGRVHGDSFFSALERFGRRSCVDLVVTSPPYLNNYHYPRNTRPQLHWLGFASGTGYKSAREMNSFGKFWQTVRDQEPIALAFDLSALNETLKEIRRRNAEKGPYGGPGWANYVAT